MLRFAGFVVIVLSLCFVLAPVASTEEESGEVWIFVRGEAKRELDVTRMSEVLRQSLLAQLEAQGWKRVAVDVTVTDEQFPADEEKEPSPRPPPAPPRPRKKLDPSTKKDLAELVRRGGRFPEGFEPHGMPPFPEPEQGRLRTGFGRAAGVLILRYLELKDDPVKGPIYEAVLREMAKGLTAESTDPDADPLRVSAARIMARVLSGASDPERGPVHREIMGVLQAAMRPAATGRGDPGMAPPVPPVRPDPFLFTPLELGGAGLVLRSRPPAPPALVVGHVPPASLAQEMGLRMGDQIVAIDGRPADRDGYERARVTISRAGKLTLRVERREGQIEELEIEFEVADRPDDARKR